MNILPPGAWCRLLYNSRPRSLSGGNGNFFHWEPDCLYKLLREVIHRLPASSIIPLASTSPGSGNVGSGRQSGAMGYNMIYEVKSGC